MSDLKFFCIKCGQSLEAPDELLGSTIQCPTCNATLTVPGKRVSIAPRSSQPNTKPCPFCSEQIMSTAMKCRYCGELLDPVLRAAEESRRTHGVQIANITSPPPPRYAELDAENPHTGLVVGGWFTAFLMPLVGLILGIVLLFKGKRYGHAIAIMVVSVTMMCFWASFWESFWESFSAAAGL